MSTKSFALSKEDPVGQQFNSGLEAWERPFDAPGSVGRIRKHGAPKTRGIRTLGTAKLPAFALPEYDSVVQQFKTGLEGWERPFERQR